MVCVCVGGGDKLALAPCGSCQVWKPRSFPPSCFWLLFYCSNKWPTGVWERLGPQVSEGRAVRLTSCPYAQGALHTALSPFTQLRLVDHNAPGTSG